MNTCACCDKKIPVQQKQVFSFRKCLNQHGNRAHRICAKCWWQTIIPASQEQHLKCPGCLARAPLYVPPATVPKAFQTQKIIQILDN